MQKVLTFLLLIEGYEQTEPSVF